MASLIATRSRVEGANVVGSWAARHNAAVARARCNLDRGGMTYGDHGEEQAHLVRMLQAWADYAGVHRCACGSPIGQDGVLGKAWAEAGHGMRTLLNGSLGDLDGGTLDAFIMNTLAENGVKEDS